LVCKEKNIEPYDVLNANEAFMTGTPFCMLPVSSLNGQQIGDRPMGEVTQLLLDTWGDNVGLNIEEQIKMYSQETTKPKISPYQFNRTD